MRSENVQLAATSLDPQVAVKHAVNLRELFPFFTSLGFHAGLIGVGLLAYQTIHIINDHTGPIEQTNFAFTEWRSDPMADPDGVAVQISTTGTKQFPTQDDFDQPNLKGWAHKPGASADDPGSPSASDGDVIAIGPHQGFGNHGTGPVGTGGFDGPGDGTGTGGRVSTFGKQYQIGIGRLFKDDKPAKSVAFVCDRSGSMLNKLGALKGELNKVVQNLHPTQSFDLIFFSESRPLSLSPSLLPGTPQSKRRAATFLEDVTASGTTDPLPALRLAFAQKPEVIFLLTDGDFPDNQAVRAEIQKLNAKGQVRVNTIAFIDATDESASFSAFLKAVATENRGLFRPVKAEDLQ